MSFALSPDAQKKVKAIKLFVLDVDGVLTDGKIIINDDGVESKNFNVRDGMAMAIARRKGYRFAVISGRYSKVVEHRITELGIEEIHQNVSDKRKKFYEVLEKLGLEAKEAAFIGDDINDMPIIEVAGLSAAPKDGDESVLEKVDFVSRFNGGEGAVREFVETVLKEHRQWGL